MDRKPALMFWNLERMTFRDEPGGDLDDEAEAAAPSDDVTPIGGMKPKGPNINQASHGFASNFIWFWLHSTTRLTELLG